MKKLIMIAFAVSTLSACSHSQLSTYQAEGKTDKEICYDYGRYVELNQRYNTQDWLAVNRDLREIMTSRKILNDVYCEAEIKNGRYATSQRLNSDIAYKARIESHADADHARSQSEWAANSAPTYDAFGASSPIWDALNKQGEQMVRGDQESQRQAEEQMREAKQQVQHNQDMQMIHNDLNGIRNAIQGNSY